MILLREERLAWAMFTADGKTNWGCGPEWLKQRYMEKAAKVQQLLKGFADAERENGPIPLGS